MKMAIATTMLCGATFGGHYVLTSDNGAFPPPASSVMTPSRPSFQGSTPTANRATSATATAVPRVAPSSVFDGRSGGSSSSGMSGGAASLSGNAAITPFSSPSGRLGGASPAAAGGGGAVASASALSSAVAGYAVSSAGGGASLSFAPRRSGETQTGPNPFNSNETLDVYNGDKPGVITGEENGYNDNPSITSYGQPIGDMVWPLLLMVLVYGFCMIMRKYKLNRHR